jgi:hypothetical protein
VLRSVSWWANGRRKSPSEYGDLVVEGFPGHETESAVRLGGDVVGGATPEALPVQRVRNSRCRYRAR